MPHTSTHHHQHLRKRAQQKNKPYSPVLEKNLDRALYILAILMPFFTASQVIQIWWHQSAQDVSLIAWSSYLFSSFVWIMYGIVHKEKPIIFTNAINLLINFFVVTGTVIYG